VFFLPLASEHRFLRSYSFAVIARVRCAVLVWRVRDVRGLLQQRSLTPSPRGARKRNPSPRARAKRNHE
jgi:hypothetical protein